MARKMYVNTKSYDYLTQKNHHTLEGGFLGLINFESKLQIKKYFGRAFPNWRVWVIPVVEIQGFHTFVSKNPIRFSDGSVSINMYLTLAFVKEFGFKAGEAWSEITEYAYGCLSYSDFATTEMLIPEGSEYLFNDVHTAEADELYHHVLDKYGWARRDPKYKSETELCAMLKWAKEKGLTIEELSI